MDLIELLKVFSEAPIMKGLLNPTIIHGDYPLVVILGDNASGKSCARKVIKNRCSQSKIHCMDLSLAARARGGVEKCFIYGSEEDESSGSNSASTFLKSLETSIERDISHYIIWDEPDLGLSDSWAASMGKELNDFYTSAPSLLLGGFLITHNRALLSQLRENPYLIVLGSKVKSLQEWLDQPITIKPLSELHDRSLVTWRKIQGVIKGNNELFIKELTLHKDEV